MKSKLGQTIHYNRGSYAKKIDKEKEQKFIDFYCEGEPAGNATQSAIKAGWENNKSIRFQARYLKNKYKEDYFEIINNYNNEVKGLHTCPKPVELVQNLLVNQADNNGIVLDIFLGSGTTLIACEKTGRKCYGMELDPHY